jgi:hypothetical protein
MATEEDKKKIGLCLQSSSHRLVGIPLFVFCMCPQQGSKVDHFYLLHAVVAPDFRARSLSLICALVAEEVDSDDEHDHEDHEGHAHGEEKDGDDGDSKYSRSEKKARKVLRGVVLLSLLLLLLLVSFTLRSCRVSISRIRVLTVPRRSPSSAL